MEPNGGGEPEQVDSPEYVFLKAQVTVMQAYMYEHGDYDVSKFTSALMTSFPEASAEFYYGMLAQFTDEVGPLRDLMFKTGLTRINNALHPGLGPTDTASAPEGNINNPSVRD